MASFSIVIKPSALKELEALPRVDRERVVARIDALATEPRPQGVVRLVGREEYRLRQGNYRVVYMIEDDVRLVRVMRIAHRRDAYP